MTQSIPLAGATGAAPLWSHDAVRQLLDLAREDVSAEVISLKLKRPVSDVRAKASELGVHLKVGL